MFGNWATVFLILRYGTVYFYSVTYSLAYWPFASQSTIPSIDEIVVSMVDIDPVHRLDAKEAKDRLGSIVCSMAPESLLIRPDNPKRGVPMKSS